MTNIDQFESVFKSAAKTVFEFVPISFKKCLAVSDAGPDAARPYLEMAKSFFDSALEDDTQWELITRDELHSVSRLLERVGQIAPDLICTYRNLMQPAGEHPYSLGVHLDVMTQATEVPVLVTPHPQSAEAKKLNEIESVMAITDHLSGEHRLANAAAAVTPAGGTLWLTHVEDEAMFERYMHTISKIPEIDTDVAREMIMKKLLQDPSDYIDSCRKAMDEAGARYRVEKVVALGHHLTDYKRLIEEHGVDLLVLNTKDEDQLAMHGLAYPLSVELTGIPMLLL